MRSHRTLLILSLAFLLGLASSARAQDLPTQHLSHLPSYVIDRSSLTNLIRSRIGLDIELIAVDTQRTPWSEHFRFRLVYDGIPFWNGDVKWNRYANGGARCSYPKLNFPIRFSNEEMSDEMVKEFIESNYSSIRTYSFDIQWVLHKGYARKSWIVQVEFEGGLEELILNASGELEQRSDLVVHDDHDTLVDVNIFLPDPITAARTEYGGAFADNQDAASQALNDAMLRGEIPMTYNASLSRWELTTEFATAEDIDPPTIAPPSFASVSSANLLVDRSDDSFEYFNAYFHILSAHAIYNKLGFEVVDFPLRFDAHGTTSDQSSYTPSETSPYLRFGDGGVDDAEDAEVVIHEYGHAVIHSVSPATNIGSERNALDEGLCDYLAVSYSARVTDYNRATIFDWDGHNEFWSGRVLTDTRSYPTDIQDNLYADGLLWASALAEVAAYLGEDVTDQLALQSLYSWFPNMKLSDAGALLLLSDSLINLAQNADVVSAVLCSRGLLPGCEDTLLSETPIADPYLGNSFDFAYNNEPLFIYPNRNGIVKLEVFDLKGRIVHEEDWEAQGETFRRWAGTMLSQGVYIMRLSGPTSSKSFKIIKLW